jgi:hypothetical protein
LAPAANRPAAVSSVPSIATACATFKVSRLGLEPITPRENYAPASVTWR